LSASFAALPLYFQALVLVSLGLWCWGSNVHGLVASGIDVQSLLEHRAGDRGWHHRAVYALAATVSVVTCVSLYFFLQMAEKYGEEGSEGWVVLTYVALLVGLVWPWNVGWRNERYKFLRSLRRIAFGGIRSEVPFSDVLLADILTSFSKVFGDLQPVFTDLVLDDHSIATVSHGGGAWSELIAPMLVSIPFLFRLRQCIAEHNLATDEASRSRHLANAVKYISSLPVIASSFLVSWMRVQQLEERERRATVPSRAADDTAWEVDVEVVLSMINSLYSLYWDVYMDWHLGNRLGRRAKPRRSEIPPPITTSGSSSTYPPFLRPILHFPYPSLYYLAIVLDSSMRFAWLLRLVPRHVTVRAAGFSFAAAATAPAALDAGLKVLELLRRWMWVFFRVEREWVSRGAGIG
ncbi:EXS family-domain-containing protein, partial [Blyttiomyces helicus]